MTGPRSVSPPVRARPWIAEFGLLILAGCAIVAAAVAQAAAAPCSQSAAAAFARFAGLGLAFTCVGALAADRISLLARHRSETERLARGALSDPVTGLLNRTAFINRLETQSRNAAADTAILAIDIDRFKYVNDAVGGHVNDGLLAAAAARLRELLGESTALARTGDSEFAAQLAPEPEAAEALAARVTDALAQPFIIEGNRVHAGASAGVAFGDLLHDRADELLARARFAMQEATTSDAARYRIFDDRMSDRLSLKTEVRAALGPAIAADEFELHFQPIVAASTGRLVAAEALLRWRSPHLGSVSPDVFIPIAEESGEIIALSEWVLDRALEAIVRLGDVPVGVNISPVQFRERGFVTALSNRVIAAGIRPALFYIEITEGVLISQMESARRTISQLRNMGIKVYLDDFGTGYSSLSYLQNFELDAMKIDKSFLRGLDRRGRADRMLRSVIDLGHSLEVKVVAEGVESEAQMTLLRALGCDYLQGYYTAGPMPFEALVAFRDKNRLEADAAEARL